MLGRMVIDMEHLYHVIYNSCNATAHNSNPTPDPNNTSPVPLLLTYHSLQFLVRFNHTGSLLWKLDSPSSWGYWKTQPVGPETVYFENAEFPAAGYR